MRYLFSLLTFTFAYLAFAVPAFAQNVNPCDQGNRSNDFFRNLCQLGFTSIGGVISNLILIILIIAVIIALFFLIYGGIKWILSGGDKAGVEAARNHIVAAIVGLVIALAAFFIINIILSIFGLSLGSLQLPKLI